MHIPDPTARTMPLQGSATVACVSAQADFITILAATEKASESRSQPDRQLDALPHLDDESDLAFHDADEQTQLSDQSPFVWLLVSPMEPCAKADTDAHPDSAHGAKAHPTGADKPSLPINPPAFDPAGSFKNRAASPGPDRAPDPVLASFPQDWKTLTNIAENAPSDRRHLQSSGVGSTVLEGVIPQPVPDLKSQNRVAGITTSEDLSPSAVEAQAVNRPSLPKDIQPVFHPLVATGGAFRLKHAPDQPAPPLATETDGPSRISGFLSGDEARPQHPTEELVSILAQNGKVPNVAETGRISPSLDPLHAPPIGHGILFSIEGAPPLPPSNDTPDLQSRGAMLLTPSQLPAEVRRLAPILSDGPVVLTLSPEELGALQIRAQETERGLHLHLTVDQPATLDLLRRQGEQILAELRHAGFQNLSFSFAGQGDPSGHNSHGDAPSPHGPPADPQLGAMADPATSPVGFPTTGYALNLRL